MAISISVFKKNVDYTITKWYLITLIRLPNNVDLMVYGYFKTKHHKYNKYQTLQVQMY